MGCDDYGYDSAEASREHEYYQKLYKIREELKQVSLGSFMATDLPSILRLLNFQEGGYSSSRPHYNDLEQIESRLSKIKAKESKTVFKG